MAMAAPLLMGTAATGATTAAAAATGMFGGAAGAMTAAATTAATGGLFGIGGAFSAMQTLSTVGGLFSMGSSLAAGNAAGSDYEAQAAWERVKAANTRVDQAREALQVREKTRRIQAQNAATFAARGLTLEGSPETLFEEVSKQAERELDITRYNADQAVDSSRGQAAAFRAKASSARAGGRARAVGTLFDMGASLYEKGGL
ncbi:MAG: hypothetical protein K0U84_13390 [Actinomycetia bacterium]|nr:hypothetical protein [Actinomycetes bacterium]